MAGGVAIGIAAIVVWGAGGELAGGAPFVALWIASPAVARWTSLSPLVAGRVLVSEADARALRLVARRTWRYFETFVTVADHMLPPDNFQEDPTPVLAHRTSPTNLGLYLLSAVSARDFGWTGTTDTIERLEATLATMSGLQRFRGHFYNWYDTGDLRPLDPRYVSSVDSGNLAGHLIAIANACRKWIGCPLAASQLFAGIDDALSLARDAIRALPDDRRTQFATAQELDRALDALGAALGRDHSLPEELPARLMNLASGRDRGRYRSALAAEREMRSVLKCSSGRRRYRDQSTVTGDVTQTATIAQTLNQRLATLESTARSMAEAMEFGFLLDPDRNLLSIGYLVPEGKLDTSCYDLLASEARLASFMAIAKGDVPARHWFHLGRAVTPLSHGAALISWSGSMFEYLMPSLVMRAPTGSLIEQTNRLIVRRQMSYGAALGLPWGISESAYNARDSEFTYQYSNFGVPGLGLKRGLSENAVVAPYATALATMVEPAASARNLARLAAVGASGRYGFYEALDYTRSRLPEGKDYAIVRAFMAHHQGMTVVAIANALLDGEMRARFHAEPIIQATELLLQERTPRDVAAARPRAEEVRAGAAVRGLELPTVRRLHSVHAATPEVQLLSNSRYAVMLTGAGSGYSRWHDLGITRWCEDATRDDWGAYVFLRDVHSGDVWSAGYQPSGVEPASYDVRFSEDRAEFQGAMERSPRCLKSSCRRKTTPEVRRLSVSNAGNRVRDIELTSYAELALAPPAADAAHLTFSKLFVQTEYDARLGAILATRRRRSPTEPEIWAAHLAVVEGETVGRRRSRPIEPFPRPWARCSGAGRGDGRPLSNTVGTVLDPVFAVRRRVRVQTGRNGAHLLLDRRRIVSRRCPRPGRQASRRPCLRACRYIGVDPGARAAGSSWRRC